MSDLFRNDVHIVGFPTRRLNYIHVTATTLDTYIQRLNFSSIPLNYKYGPRGHKISDKLSL